MYIKVSSVIIAIVMNQFIENDTNFDSNSKVKSGVDLQLIENFLFSAKQNCK